MTPREEQLLEAVERLTAARGFPPTLRELAADMELSLARIAQLMDACESAGRVNRVANVARSWRVVRPAARCRT